MNKNQREIIIDAYEQWLNCGHRADPVGFFGDMGDYFKKLKNTDKKLQDEMQETLNEYENEED